MTLRTDLLVEWGYLSIEEAAWQSRAACIGLGPELFFPPRGHSAMEAKRVCSSCAVWRECLETALASHDRLSVAGGTTEKERRVILRARRRGQPVELRRPAPPPIRTGYESDTSPLGKMLHRRAYARMAAEYGVAS